LYHNRVLPHLNKNLTPFPYADIFETNYPPERLGKYIVMHEEKPGREGYGGLAWKRRAFSYFSTLKPLGIIFALYVFILSITLLGDAMKLFGKDFAEALISTTSNPAIGLFIGILATSIIQSSSTTTCILVGLVGGGMIPIENAVPIVMGANIGTTITNTLVSLAHVKRKIEFGRAFAGAIVHDIFNILSVAVIFPIQYFTNFLGILSTMLAEAFAHAGGFTFISPVKAATKPVSTLIISALGNHPWIIVILAIVFLLASLKLMVDIVKSLVLTRVEGFFSKHIFKTTLRALLLGAILTSVVQSSSITTSIIIPLVGAGILSLRQVYPYTLGANIGTTITAIMAALVTSNTTAIAVAFAHLIFNLSGMAIFLPLAKIPISLAKQMSKLTARSRLVPIAFIFVIFFGIPLILIYIFR